MRTALLLSLTLVGCTGQVDDGLDEDGSSEDAITNGVLDEGTPEVGYLIHDGAKCSFTLVGAHTVLTAAHCAINVPPSHYRLHMEAGDFLVKRVETRPDALGGQFADRDVAILELTRDVPGVRPAVLASAPPRAGEWIALLGYGRTSKDVGSDNQLRIGLNRIAEVKAGTFTHDGASGPDANTCAGDSGGPTFVIRNGGKQLLGTHSRSSCDQAWVAFGLIDDNLGIETRVDTNRGYITTWARGDVTYMH